MYFTRSVLALAVVAATAVQAAPGLSITLTKRWCGFDHSCPCDYDVETGCVPQVDQCGHQYWPAECKGCAPCLELCVDFTCSDAPAA